MTDNDSESQTNSSSDKPDNNKNDEMEESEEDRSDVASMEAPDAAEKQNDATEQALEATKKSEDNPLTTIKTMPSEDIAEESINAHKIVEYAKNAKEIRYKTCKLFSFLVFFTNQR